MASKRFVSTCLQSSNFFNVFNITIIASNYIFHTARAFDTFYILCIVPLVKLLGLKNELELHNNPSFFVLVVYF
jgi:hypothetical protein